MGSDRAYPTTPDHLPQARNPEIVQMMIYHFVSDPNERPQKLTAAQLRRLIDKNPNAITTFKRGTPPKTGKKLQGTLYLEVENTYEDPENTGWIQNAMERRKNKGKDPQEMLTYNYWLEQSSTSFGAAYVKADTATTGASRNLEDILELAPALLRKLVAQAKTSSGRLKLYRTMFKKEAEAILRWANERKQGTELLLDSKSKTEKISALSFHAKEKLPNVGIMPVTGHLGDKDQAMNYLTKDPNNRTLKTMLEFRLKPGAHKLLFTPDYMAVSRSGETPAMMNASEKKANDREFPTSAGGEGLLSGYIGVKSEEKGPFSFAIGEAEATQLLFQLFVESIRELNEAELEASEPNKSQPGGTESKAVDSGRTETQKSGNCLYEAVNILLENPVEMDVTLRQMATTFFFEHQHIAQVPGLNVDAVVDTLSTVGGWAGDAGDLAPVVLASAIRRTLRIVMRNAVYIIEPLDPPQESGLTLYLDDNHYTVTPTFTVDTDTLPQVHMKFPQKPG